MNRVKSRILKKLQSIPQQLPHHRFSIYSNALHLPDKDADNEDEPSPPDSIAAAAAADKENIDPQTPPPKSVDANPKRHREDDTDSPDLDVSSFRRPKLNSSTLFDPDLLQAFHRAVADYHRARAASIALSRGPYDPLSRFEDRCPPGGREAVVVYTTSLRGIRKTFEDCNRVKHLLSSLKVRFYERDVAADVRFREELWGVLRGRAIPPRVFVKGRYIGGAEDVVALHEMGELVPILEGVRRVSSGAAGECEECGGLLFTVCEECGGGMKVYKEGEGRGRCGRCNENGLVACSACCG